MKVTTVLRYGLRLMIEMGKNYHKKEPLSLKITARKQKIPLKYAEKIIHFLLKANLVRSVRGKEGGYLLALSPDKIKLLDIFKALEGEIYLVECVKTPKICQKSKYCSARKLWRLLSENWQKTLNKLTLKHLLKRR